MSEPARSGARTVKATSAVAVRLDQDTESVVEPLVSATPGRPSEIWLPRTFVPTHLTAGLDGFPAVDVFGPPGALVRVRFWGRVERLSGRSPALGGRPGGSYGWSVYVTNGSNGITRYCTHLGSVSVKLGQRVGPGSIIGTVCDSAVSGKPGTSHVHLGMRVPAPVA